MVSSLNYINSKLRARLANRLKESDLDNLLAKNTLLEALAVLKDSSYHTIYESYLQTGSLKSAEKAMNQEEFLLLRTLNISLTGAERNFIRSLLIFLEVKNLKNLLRSWFAHIILKRNILVNDGFIDTNLVHDIPFVEIYNASSMSQIITILEKTPYGKLISEIKSPVNQETSLYYVELALDLYAANKIFATYHLLNGPNYFFARTIIAFMMDCENLLTYLRFNHDKILQTAYQNIPYMPSSTAMQEKFNSSLLNKEKLCAFLEPYYPNLSQNLRSLDNGTLLIQLEKAYHQEKEKLCQNLLAKAPSSIAHVLAYFFFAQNDVAKITSILEAKLYGFSRANLESIL